MAQNLLVGHVGPVRRVGLVGTVESINGKVYGFWKQGRDLGG